MIDITIDLETMGTATNAPIVAIGAVAYVDGTEHTFYVEVDLASSVASGAVMSAPTVLWWLQQSDEARAIFVANQLDAVSLTEALQRFAAWLNIIEPSVGDRCMWGNGAAFDNTILNESYLRAGLPAPWAFWNDRCYRTLKALYRDVVPVPTFEGTAHNALADAQHQHRHLLQILEFTGRS